VQPAFPLLVQTLCDLAPLGKDLEILFCWKKRRKVNHHARLRLFSCPIIRQELIHRLTAGSSICLRNTSTVRRSRTIGRERRNGIPGKASV